MVLNSSHPQVSVSASEQVTGCKSGATDTLSHFSHHDSLRHWRDVGSTVEYSLLGSQAMFGHRNDPLTIQREAMSVETLLVQIIFRDECCTVQLYN